MNPEEMQEPVDNQQEEGQEQPFDPNSAPEWHDPNMDPSQVQEMPDEQHPSFQPEPEPMMVLPDVILSYMDHALEIRRDETLDSKVKADIMSALANSIATLVPLLKDDSQMEMMKMQAELQMKEKEMEMNMQMKQAELEFKKQEHEMKMQHSQQENEVKLAMTQASNAMQLKQQEENHNSKLVQSDQSHGQKMEQQKQATQLKQSSKPSNDKGKK